MIGVLGKALRCLTDERWVPGLVQPAQREMDAEGPLPPPPIGLLQGHDSVGLNPRQLQGKLGNLVNAATYARIRDALASLPEADRPPEVDDSFRGLEARDHARIIPASEYVTISRRFLGIEPYITTVYPCHWAIDVGSDQARTCDQEHPVVM